MTRETPKAMKARHLATLGRAYAVHFHDPYAEWRASLAYAEIRAAVKAALVGTQKAKNVRPALDAAVKAVARVIRRRQ